MAGSSASWDYSKFDNLDVSDDEPPLRPDQRYSGPSAGGSAYAKQVVERQRAARAKPHRVGRRHDLNGECVRVGLAEHSHEQPRRAAWRGWLDEAVLLLGGGDGGGGAVAATAWCGGWLGEVCGGSSGGATAMATARRRWRPIR